MNVRELRRDDWPAVRAIYEDGIRGGDATFETEAPSWEAWDAVHPQLRLVAERDGTVVGWAALSPYSPRRCYRGVGNVSVYVGQVTPEEVGPNALRLDAASRAKLVAAGVDPDQVERELHGMQRGDRKLLADVVYGANADTPRAEVDEQVRWFGIVPTEDEEQRIARGETVTFLVDA